MRKGKYEVTPEDEAFRRADESISAKEDMLHNPGCTRQIKHACLHSFARAFRFNPGKEEKTVPDYNPYSIRQCKTCPIAKETTELAKSCIPSNEECQACALIRECVQNKVKTAAAIERMHYLHEMEPLLNKKIPLKTDEKDINVGFTKYGNKHLYSDTFGRTKILTKADLKTLNETLKKSTFIDKADLTHPRHDNIVKFFYYDAELHGEHIRLNVAKKVEKLNNGYVQETHFLYSVNDIKKSTSGGA